MVPKPATLSARLHLGSAQCFYVALSKHRMKATSVSMGRSLNFKRLQAVETEGTLSLSYTNVSG